MIDFFKARIVGYPVSKFLANPKLKFEFKNLPGTEYWDKRKQLADLNSLELIVYHSGTIILKGSIHKYANKDLSNWDQFNFSRLRENLAKVLDLLEIEPECIFIQNLETGVNIRPPQPTRRILEGLISYKTTPFVVPKTNSKGKGLIHPVKFIREAPIEDKSIKVYDKALEYNLPSQVLRYEIKLKRSREIKKIGITTFADLFDTTWQPRSRDLLLTTWDQIIFVDPGLKECNLNRYQLETKYHQWRDYSYWISLNKFSRSRQRQYLENLSRGNSLEAKERLRAEISTTWENLCLT